MAKLSLWFDPSASMSKGIYRVNSSPAEFMMMESAYLPVEPSTIEGYQKKKLATGVSSLAPEREAWVKIQGQYYVVGELAQREFNAFDHLRFLKHETLVPKIVAMVGAIAIKKGLKSRFNLELGVLIPYGEKRDAITFQSLLLEALSGFRFQGREYEVVVESYDAKPEGYGVLAQGATRNLKKSRILVLMVGYRNASYLLSQKGVMSGETCRLGFSQMLDEVVQLTSGYQSDSLVAPIYQSGIRLKKQPLLAVLRNTQAKAREKELNTLQEAIKKAQVSYLGQLTQWWESRKFPEVDEVILAGGTGRYYGTSLDKKVRSLTAFLAHKPHIGWAVQIEEQLRQKLTWLQQQEYEYRLTDLYGYYCLSEVVAEDRALGGVVNVSA